MRLLPFVFLLACGASEPVDQLVFFGDDAATAARFEALALEHGMGFARHELPQTEGRVVAVGVGASGQRATELACSNRVDALVLIDAGPLPADCPGVPVPLLHYSAEPVEAPVWLTRNHATRSVTVDEPGLSCELWWGAAATALCVREPGTDPLAALDAQSGLGDPLGASWKWTMGGWTEQESMRRLGLSHHH